MIQSSSLLYPVADLPAALGLFQDALGMQLRLRDGLRYAALEAGATRLALLSGSERIVEGPALGLRVADLRGAIAALCAAGAQLVSAPESGPHERRAVLRDAAGNPLVLSCRLAR